MNLFEKVNDYQEEVLRMEYNLPEVLLDGHCPIFDLVVKPGSQWERYSGIMLSIACAAIKNAGKQTDLGVGWLDPNIKEELITLDDIFDLGREAVQGVLFLDRWKGRSVKLQMKEEDGHVVVDLIAWAELYDGTDETFSIISGRAVAVLRNVLEIAQKQLDARHESGGPRESVFVDHSCYSIETVERNMQAYIKKHRKM